MKRLLRILLNAATAVSLMLCVATIVLWVRSQWSSDELGYRYATVWKDQPAHREVVCQAFQGSIRVGTILDAFASKSSADAAQTGRDLRIRMGLTYANGAAEELDPWDGGLGRWGFYWHRPSGRAYGTLSFRDDAVAYKLTRYYGRAFALPWWFLTVALLVLPARALWRWARTLGRPSTACSVCGYDLRATPDRCPECGTVSAAQTPA
ncbi:MAG TPA: hypothetical protein VH475_05355 [Tepidisphaeraceae bacterium]